MEKLQKTIDSLNKNGFKARLFETADEAKTAAIELIGSSSVGFGGSVTIDSLGIYEALAANGNAVYWHWKSDDKTAMRKSAMSADFYLSSSNAVTEAGKLVNIDGHGNRVAAMFYGPQKVLIIAGRNKIAPDTDAAIARIKKYACGPNAARLGIKTPCAVTNTCIDCDSPNRICRVTSIIDRPMVGGHEVTVYLVNQDLGY